MVIKRNTDRDFLRDRFAILRNCIETDVALNLTNLNISVENFFRDLLNILLKANFENLNVSLGNAAAIDLADKGRRHCIQVTSTAGKPKIDKTLNKFVEHGLNKDYDKLTIFIVTKKNSYQKNTLSDRTNLFTISTKDDVWDWRDIMKLADNLHQDRLAELKNYVEKGIVVAPTNEPRNEVATFFALMETLSDETHEQAGTGKTVTPDPDGKINRRFSEHSEYLSNEYSTYYMEYGPVLEDVLKQGDLGAARMRRLGLHLSTKSNEVLSDAGGNPATALKNLVDFYFKTLQDHGKASDEGAIRFFMLDQMIRCHVFPNPVSGSV